MLSGSLLQQSLRFCVHADAHFDVGDPDLLLHRPWLAVLHIYLLEDGILVQHG